MVSGCFDRVVIVPGDSDRNMNCDELAEKARKYFSQVISCNKTNQVLDIIKNMLDNEVLIIFGSFSIMKKYIKVAQKL